jgi:putative CRISPR-associated protein (TIGR02619 family)
MNIIFVTVGLTAIENPDIGRAPDGRSNATLGASVKQYKLDPIKEEARYVPLREDLCDAHKAFWEQCDDYRLSPLNCYQTSAELLSTWLFLRRQHIDPQTIVLLASDTNDSQFAMEITRIQFVRLYPNATVVGAVIRDLDSELRVSPEAGRPIIRKYKRRADDDAYLNITGGFKGTVALLTILAREFSLRTFYQHEKLGRPVLVDIDG